MIRRNPSYRGFVLPLVLLILFLVASFAISYFQFGRFSQSTSFRLELREACRMYSQSALEEGLIKFHLETAREDSEAGKWLLGNDPTMTLGVPTTDLAMSTNPWGFSHFLKLEISRVDCRTKGITGTPFFGKERLGTLAFTAFSEFRKPNGEKIVGCQFIRHHEFRIAAIVTPQEKGANRTQYKPGFTLDYSLLVRNGFEEFQRTNGKNLNSNPPRLELLQPGKEKAGKIYFGDTESSAADPDKKPIFLNIHESLAGIIPKAPGMTSLGIEDLVKLFPELDRIKDLIPGVKGQIIQENKPLCFDADPGNSLETESRKFLSDNPRTHIEANVAPGLWILSRNPALACDPDFAKEILEGSVRQRFHHFAFFQIDQDSIADFSDFTKETLKKYSLKVCFPFGIAGIKQSEMNFIKGLREIAGQRNDPNLIAHLNSDFLYQGKQGPSLPGANPSFDRPSFFDRRNRPVPIDEAGPGLVPFQSHELWSKGFANPTQFQNSGYLDKRTGRLFLRGILWIENGRLVIGDSTDPAGETKFAGCGAVMCNALDIFSGLEPETEKDIVVFNAYPNRSLPGLFPVRIGTSKEIHASLIVTNNQFTGCLLPSVPMKISGAVVVDILGMNSWAPGEHTIQYDERLKPERDIYSITISPVPQFQRISESDSQ